MSGLDPFLRLLEDEAGLDPGATGAEAVSRAVTAGAASCGCTGPEEYYGRIVASSRERERFLEAFLVHETWFFRDSEPFVLLRRYLREEWLPAHPGAIFRVLSVPCSTGEEPYSLAISLLEEGIAPERFRIDAADISREGLEAARRAVYGPASFREDAVPPGGWFSPVTGGLRLDDRVRRAVHFHRADLREPGFLRDAVPYDVVFCRNLIVYLSPAARRHAWANLDRLLAPDGVIFAGSAEVSFFHALGLTPVRHPRSFALRRAGRAGVSASPERRAPRVSKRPAEAIPRPERPRRTTATPPAGIASSPVRESSPPEIFDLDAIRVLADRGELEEALSRCERLKEAGNAGAGAYVLAGLIQYELGRLDASEENLLRAVYLDPRHYEALVHLGLLYHRRGDAARAALYRKRSERVKGKD